MSDEPINPNDVPLEAREGSTPYSSPVIDLAEVRIAYGLPKPGQRVCSHRRLIYCRSERRVWCEDCESTVESFDAFMTVTEHFHLMEREARAKLARAAEAEAATLVKRASKNLDRQWNGKHPMAVSCPHCRGGLLPEDFIDGGSAVSRDIELARRKRAIEGKEK
jgi:hypothetical protein